MPRRMVEHPIGDEFGMGTVGDDQHKEVIP